MQAGDYAVLEELGAGGMGKVFKVRNMISDRVEAMKVLLPDLVANSDLAERFLREIKVQAALDHPNIAGLRTALRFENQLLMVMEFVEGRTMDSWLEQGAIPLPNAIWVTMQVLEALEYAHTRGIVHRDIKPSNIMITTAGVVKLMDFGIAKVIDDPSLTQGHQTTGSLYYMSPEQINGQALDGRADLYSLGITLYQFVTGKRPFDAQNTYGIMAAHLTQPPLPPIEHDPSLPPAISQIILTALAKDPNGRFASAADFRGALGQVLQQLRNPAAAAAPAGYASPPAAGPAPGNIPPRQPEMKQGMSSRTMYMLAGSMATVVVLVLLAVQGPKFFRTSAQQDPAVTQIQQPAAGVPATAGDPNQPAATSVDTSVRPEPAQQQTAPGASTNSAPAVAAPIAVSSLKSSIAMPQQTGAATSAHQPAAAAAVQQLTPATVPPAAQQTMQQTTQQPAVDRAALNQLRRRMMQMAQRYAATQTAYKSLREQMAQEGLRPRTDLGSMSQRVAAEMDEAEDSLKQNDTAQAAQHLDNAERTLEQLEKFFRL